MAIQYATYDEFFRVAFNAPEGPFDYQRRLALDDSIYSLVNVPTGAGKTAAVLGAWLWRRQHNPSTVGRRLVYCLPMRALVEQTRDVAKRAIDRLSQNLGEERFSVHILMGGDVDNEWEHYPERECILIGTQDMLLSRALNRGYALKRFKWPVHFGLLNNDCLWVMDEVQLMGSGLATSAQLQAFRRMMGSFGNVQTIWMSATVRQDWLVTVDVDPEKDAKGELFLDLAEEPPGVLHDVMLAKKLVQDAKAKAGDNEKIAKKVLAAHKNQSRTLVIVNTVKRAKELHIALKQALTQKKSATELVLIHSRFRPPDRKEAINRLLNDPTEEGTIIVSTQVVEAGVDVSARTLFTELAPWASLVQRFGRCNRKGKKDEDGAIYWIDVKNSEPAPYDEADLKLAREHLKKLEGKEVGPQKLREYLDTLDEKEKEKLLGYEHVYAIRYHDLHGLFSTEADLAGGYTDVSMYVRNSEHETDVYVYWRDFKGEPSREEPALGRNELCPVRLPDLKSFLGKTGTAWQWNTEGKGKWEQRRATDIRPGMTLLLAINQGGYHKDFGWTGKASDKPTAIPDLDNTRPQDSMDDELPSLIEGGWWSVPNHLRDTQAEAFDIIQQLQFAEKLWEQGSQSVILAAWWHDVGKTLKRWQEAAEKQIEKMKEKAGAFLASQPNTDEAELVRRFLARLESHLVSETLWAKFPSLDEEMKRAKLSAEARKRIKHAVDVRFLPGLRHEVGSAMAAWQEWQNGLADWNALAVYLVVCHHGKVRTVLRGTKSGEDVFGIEPEETLPQMAGWLSSERTLDLFPKAFGAIGEWNDAEDSFTVTMPSWVGMIAELLGPELPDDPDPHSAIPGNEPRNLGPFRLAFLEALIRAADVKASRRPGKGKRDE